MIYWTIYFIIFMIIGATLRLMKYSYRQKEYWIILFAAVSIRIITMMEYS